MFSIATATNSTQSPRLQRSHRVGQRAAKFELFKDTAGKFRFHLKAANGEIIAASQGYTSKAAAQNGIASIKDNAASAPTEHLT